MQVLQQCREAMSRLTKEIASATGKNIRGEYAGKSRFPGFQLMPEISAKVLRAIDLVGEGKPQEAFDAMEETLRHLQSMQVAYLRNRGLESLGKEVRSLIGVANRKTIDPIYALFNEFSKYCSGPKIDLDEAANYFYRILGAVEAQHEKVRREEEVARQQRARHEEEAAVRRQAQLATDCHKLAEELRQMVAA